ncbi:flagellar hook-basal body complex protein [Clostridium sp. BL-8]|uniref:flagellar hook-basal body protein n=1 Tax=Clostridium sp. BL-8 TaxID=349938 RepID=UPI00098CDBD5|nr:flagellar hook-basal body complex protein [Clostridium sp. BL-8]OOM79935.1 flagellar basal-body rod protein FlgG [Clostridium sp. BL-8]
MSRAMNTAITAMKANQTKLDVISNNIANSTTTAFKSSSVNFADTLYQASAGASAPTANTGGTNAQEVGLGANVSSIDKLMSTGNMESTGRTLDLANDGDGYFIVTKGSADESLPITNNAFDTSGTGTATGTTYDTAYTRDGNFHLDENGNLVTSNGYRVMGYYAGSSAYTVTNGVISISETGLADPDTSTYDGTKLQPLVIPSTVTTSGTTTEAVTGFAIGSDGVVTITVGSGKTYAIGQVARANFTNPEGLEDKGNNFLAQSGNSGAAQISSCKTLASGTTDNSGSFGAIRSGYLEASNVDLTTEFANMITTSKSFQAASKMITNESDMLDTVIGLIR